MCKLIEEEGLYLDVVSGGELYTAYKADFSLEYCNAILNKVDNVCNKIPKAVVFMVKYRKYKIICKRESYDDIIKNELM